MFENDNVNFDTRFGCNRVLARPVVCLCKGNSKTASTTTSSNSVDDSRVAASENSTAVGAGATVNVTTSDAEVVGDVLDFAGQVAAEGGDVVDAGVRLGESAMLTASDLTGKSLNFGRDALDAMASTAKDAGVIMQQAQETYAANLARNAGDAPQTIAQDSQRLLVYAVVGVAALGTVAFIATRKK